MVRRGFGVLLVRKSQPNFNSPLRTYADALGRNCKNSKQSEQSLKPNERFFGDIGH
jgi:hypothetical protein